jgi:Na+/H+-dicarboxylate symporter
VSLLVVIGVLVMVLVFAFWMGYAIVVLKEKGDVPVRRTPTRTQSALELELAK